VGVFAARHEELEAGRVALAQKNAVGDHHVVVGVEDLLEVGAFILSLQKAHLQLRFIALATQIKVDRSERDVDTSIRSEVTFSKHVHFLWIVPTRLQEVKATLCEVEEFFKVHNLIVGGHSLRGIVPSELNLSLWRPLSPMSFLILFVLQYQVPEVVTVEILKQIFNSALK